jgi:hypothetical protein
VIGSGVKYVDQGGGGQEDQPEAKVRYAHAEADGHAASQPHAVEVPAPIVYYLFHFLFGLNLDLHLLIYTIFAPLVPWFSSILTENLVPVLVYVFTFFPFFKIPRGWCFV